MSHVFRRELPFTKTNFLINPYNENLPVKIGRDGQVRVILYESNKDLVCVDTFPLYFLQEIEPNVGEALCRLFTIDDNIDLRAIAIKARHRMKRMEREGGGPGFTDNSRPPPMAPPPHFNGGSGGGGRGGAPPFRGGGGGSGMDSRLGQYLSHHGLLCGRTISHG